MSEAPWLASNARPVTAAGVLADGSGLRLSADEPAPAEVVDLGVVDLVELEDGRQRRP